MPVLDVADFDPASALAAAHAGADRVELCRDASAGGLTPPVGWVERVTVGPAPVVAMLRARAAGWTSTPGEHAAMQADARRMRSALDAL